MSAAPRLPPLPLPPDSPPPDGVLRYLGYDGCVRLPVQIDTEVLTDEIERLPPRTWSRASRDPVVQAWVESFFVIGQPRGPRPVAVDDRPVLTQLPQLRRLLRETIPAQPTRAIVARLLPNGFIPIHTDTPRFFRSTVRISIQLDAEGVQRLYCDGKWYDLRAGEVWALDNLRPHAVQHFGSRPRLNVLVDYLPDESVRRLLAAGEVGLGKPDHAAEQQIASLSRAHYRKNRWRAARYELFKLLWRRAY